MPSPHTPKRADREMSVQSPNPAVRLLTAAVILFTGAGISAIFWKMPSNTEMYDLCRTEIIDKEMAAVPLPRESVAAISQADMQQMSLPTLDIMPAADSGADKYAQVYEAPASLQEMHAGPAQTHSIDNTALETAEAASVSPVPQKFEPMRHIVEKKPISIVPVDSHFAEKPESIRTTEKSDELLSVFQFAENGKSDFVAPDAPPIDPFPVESETPAALQPLQPIALNGLSPLQPLRDGELQPLAAAIVQ